MSDNNETKIAVLQTQMSNLEGQVKTGFKETKDDIGELNRKFDAFITSAEGRFASKWVEDGLKWAISLILGAVILALVALVIKS